MPALCSARALQSCGWCWPGLSSRGSFWGPASERCRAAGGAALRSGGSQVPGVGGCREQLKCWRWRGAGCGGDCGWEKVTGESWCLRRCCLGASVLTGGGKYGAFNGSYGFRDNLGGWKWERWRGLLVEQGKSGFIQGWNWRQPVARWPSAGSWWPRRQLLLGAPGSAGQGCASFPWPAPATGVFPTRGVRWLCISDGCYSSALVPTVESKGRLRPEDAQSNTSGPDSCPEAGLGRVQINFPIALRFGVWESWGGAVKAQV